MRKLVFLASFICVVLFLSAEANAQKVEQLFNGKNLSNWNFVVKDNVEPGNKVFAVKDGVINVKGTLGYMYTKQKYSNFVLHVEWRWAEEPTNSGIFLLIEDPKTPFPNGIECQLKAGRAGDLVMLGGSDLAEYKVPAQGRPDFPVIDRTGAECEKPAGEWNHANIFVDNGVITVYVNGVYQNKATNKVKTGHIGLQSEGKAIQFKNVTVTAL